MKYDYGDYTEEEVKVFLDEFYKNQYNVNCTNCQIVGFMRWLLNLIPKEIKEEFKQSSILDWGCGTGIGLNLLREHCKHNNIYGLDMSETAIKYGKKYYPGLNLTTKPLDKNYDIIITSNCLEHFENYKEVMENHVSHCNKHYIVMIPFRSKANKNISDHVTSFDENNIPLRISNFRLCETKVLKIYDEGVWGGIQILLMYAPFKGKEIKIDFGIKGDKQHLVHCSQRPINV